jgi:hypothetical protein
MVWLAAVAIGLVGGLVVGGKIENLVHLRFRWPWFVVAALIVRASVVLTPLNRVDGIQYVYAATLAALVAWTVWQIERIPGIWLVTAGAAINLLVIAANGGRMPVASEIGGSLVQRGQIGQYTLMSQGTHLNWLADWIALPGPFQRVLREAYSPGDLIVALGVALVVLLAMRTRPDETSRRIVSDPP